MHAEAFLAEHPNIQGCEVLLFDLNGLPRGKWIPREQLQTLIDAGLRMPRSVLALDLWGREVSVPGTGIDVGDPDGACVAALDTLVPVPWLDDAAQMIISMPAKAGEGCPDPRSLLQAGIAQLRELGLQPVVAAEIEFYLLAPDLPARAVEMPHLPKRGRHLGVDALDAFSPLFREVRAACAAQCIPIDSIVSEFGVGQFEISLRHQTDALRAADHAVTLRRLLKGVARRHGMIASFMAKPFGDQAGSGLHLHMSMLDEDGRNVFDDGSPRGSALLASAVGGCLATMAECGLLFWPHFNSYRRLRRDSYAPVAATWGYDNRTTALRIPAGAASGRRFEHRVAGADANPYLVLAAVLAGVQHGIRHSLSPPPAVHHNAYAQQGPSLPGDWPDAISTFERSGFIETCFGRDFRTLFAACKRSEAASFAARVTDFEYEAYLQTF